MPCVRDAIDKLRVRIYTGTTIEGSFAMVTDDLTADQRWNKVYTILMIADYILLDIFM